MANRPRASVDSGMSRAWGLWSDRTFDCRHCGAKYALGEIASTVPHGDGVYCDVCWQKMDEWHSSPQPSYTLIERPGPTD
jgi:hypothetical protein